MRDFSLICINYSCGVQMYIHEEKFNQPIFFANNLAGKVHPVCAFLL